MEIVCIALQVYLIVCVIRVVCSLLELESSGGLMSTVATLSYAATEPVFATVRRALPMPGDLPIDLSPAIVMIGIGIVRQLLCS